MPRPTGGPIEPPASGPATDGRPQSKSDERRTKSDRLQTSDFRLQTSDFRLQTSDFRLQTSDFRLRTSAFSRRSPVGRRRSPVAGLRAAHNIADLACVHLSMKARHEKRRAPATHQMAGARRMIVESARFEEPQVVLSGPSRQAHAIGSGGTSAARERATCHRRG